MNGWELPKTICISGKEWAIRTDYRDILNVLSMFSDSDLEKECISAGISPEDVKNKTMLEMMVDNFSDLPKRQYPEAAQKCVDFINFGNFKSSGPALMDWEKDAPILIPAINQVARTEIRAVSYIHWWTFLGYYMGIGEGLFSQVVSIRKKKAKGKKLEKWEAEFYKQNREMCRLNTKKNIRSEEEKAALNKLFGR